MTVAHAAKLDSGEVLVGSGDRVVKLGFVQINVYSLGLYVDAAEAQKVLRSYAGHDHDGLIRAPSFFRSFVEGKFRKVFRLVLCRSLSKSKIVEAFDPSIRCRCDQAHSGDCDKLTQSLVPESGISANDAIIIICDADAETLRIRFSVGGSAAAETTTLELRSGGEGGCWQAFQNVFFDEGTAVPTIRHSAIAGIPEVLTTSARAEEAQLSKLARQPTEAEIERAVERGLVMNSRSSLTWSDFAGRSGDAGYQFGDITRGVFCKLGIRKQKDGDSGASDGGAGALGVSSSLSALKEANLALSKICKEQKASSAKRKLAFDDFVATVEREQKERDKVLPLLSVGIFVMAEIVVGALPRLLYPDLFDWWFTLALLRLAIVACASIALPKLLVTFSEDTKGKIAKRVKIE